MIGCLTTDVRNIMTFQPTHCYWCTRHDSSLCGRLSLQILWFSSYDRLIETVTQQPKTCMPISKLFMSYQVCWRTELSWNQHRERLDVMQLINIKDDLMIHIDSATLIKTFYT